jgi:hypothetical protein
MRQWYSVQGIPAEVLIDKNGNIIGRYLSAGAGTPDDLNAKLSGLFGR